MTPVLVVARNTFREVGRDRMLHVLGALILAFVLFSWVLGWLNPEEDDQARHLINFGLAAVNLFGLLMAVLLGSSLLRREMEQRTLYTVLSREVTRSQFLLGKYLGLVGVFAAGFTIVAVLMVVYFAVFGTLSGQPLVAAIYGNILEIAMLTAVSVLLGSFSTPAMAAFGTVSMYAAGHATETLKDYVELMDNPGLEKIIMAIYYVVPNLSNFNFRSAAAFSDPVPWSTLGMATAYAVVWCGMMLAVAAVLFRKRELP